MFCLERPWKLGQGHKALIRALTCPSIVSTQVLVKIKLLVQEILSIISPFWSKFSVFLSAVTLKIRPRSQSPYQGLSISKCCTHANFGYNQVISSGDIEHNIIFGLHSACFCLH